jgi:hypothetical protein
MFLQGLNAPAAVELGSVSAAEATDHHPLMKIISIQSGARVRRECFMVELLFSQNFVDKDPESLP